ncbi:putative cutinase family protein [Diplodia seriata]|uniref:Cutinase n=1 Tax=Diplodia seriata TaxID=420778 RepID=A0A0G2EDH7_9PEZI|nr:putative cutinase family protein [Diplodia seriata]
MQPTTILLTAIFAALTPFTSSTPIPQLTGTTTGTSTTDSTSCAPITLIFARGTFELGTMGSVVGPSLSTDLQKALGSTKLSTQGVAYAADVGGIVSEIAGGAGTAAMVAQAQKALTSCPDTKIVLSGYSQGAMLVHHAVAKLTAAQKARVVAAVTFGDPFKSSKLDGVPVAAFKTFCATGDPVCGLGGVSALSGMVSSGGDQSSSMLNHLGYGADAPAAAKFIQGRVGAA